MLKVCFHSFRVYVKNEKSHFVESHSLQVIPESQRWKKLKFSFNEVH